MKRLTISTIAAAYCVGSMGMALAANDTSGTSSGASAQTGSSPMSDSQIQQELQSAGYTNIQGLKHEGDHVNVTATKNGQTTKLVVDARTGHVAQDTDDDDD